MNFSVDYYKDEVRNGFYIPTAIKQAWAANLMVLYEIDRICEKYAITYFADWGSLLGAVRHGGYVPWDDDLDICMKRKDYIRFREVADKELPKEFAIHDFRRKEDHWLFLSRVVNSNSVSFDEDHLNRYHNFPYISVVDIFVKDYIYRDAGKRKEHCKEIKHLIAVADGIVEESFRADVVENELKNIEKRYNISIDRSNTPREKGIIIYDIAEKVMAEVPESEADEIGQIFPMILQGGTGLPKEYYDKAVRLPFENTTIPVPAVYDEMLRNRYGNYLEIHKVWTGHDYPYFEKQKGNLQAVADFSLPEFTFDSCMIDSIDRTVGMENSLRGMSQEFISQLELVTAQLKELLVAEDYTSVLEMLPEFQQFAVDYGTLTENALGEERESCKKIVEMVQGYCDALFGIYCCLTESEGDGVDVEELPASCDKLCDSIRNNIINKQEVLFLPIGASEWKGFESIYNMYTDDNRYDVYVVPLPIFFKDIYGRVAVNDENMAAATGLEAYPDNIQLTSWTDYNVSMHRPSMIYIQNPYDGENPCLTVPPQYYSEKLRRSTDKLIYVPAFIVDEFGPDDYNDVYNMKHYVTAPGVIYADEVWVQSENMKCRYVDKLTEFAGDDTSDVWNKKIKIYDNNRLIDRSGSKKSILYCLGLNELAEHKDNIEDKIKDRLEIFENNKSGIDVDVMLFPSDSNIWKKTDERLTERVLEVLKEYSQKGLCKIIDSGIIVDVNSVDNYDAYYGSASPMVPAFSVRKKPVMIANYDV